MKRELIALVSVLLILGGCSGSKQQSEDFLVVDVTANYPKKELILQDILDVEYIPLETKDDFLCQGLVQAVGKEIMVVSNFRRDGDIFLFDRKGKAVRKINRQGQGGEEYARYTTVLLDEENREIFVNEYPIKIMVYDLEGNFKRSFKHEEGGIYYDQIFNFDRENLICYDGYFTDDGVANEQSFRIVSKQDGSITREIHIPIQKKIWTAMVRRDEASQMTYGIQPPTHHPIIPHLDHWKLIEPSSDTIYTYSKDYSMKPFLARTPSVQSMDPAVFLFASVLTDRYYFLEVVEKNYNFDTTEIPSTDLVYDKEEKALFRYTVYNGDYSTKKKVYMKTPSLNSEIIACQHIPAHELVQAYEKGELKGPLKEIAAHLGEEDNPVIMLFKHKK